MNPAAVSSQLETSQPLAVSLDRHQFEKAKLAAGGGMPPGGEMKKLHVDCNLANQLAAQRVGQWHERSDC